MTNTKLEYIWIGGNGELRSKTKIHKFPIDYDIFSGLSNEIKSKLKTIKPKTLGQALRIDGVTPAAAIILLGYIKSTKKRASA